jgi:hypothetical protein
MDIQQEILLQLIDRFAALEIAFAYPGQAVFVHDAREPAAPAAAPALVVDTQGA